MTDPLWHWLTVAVLSGAFLLEALAALTSLFVDAPLQAGRQLRHVGGRLRMFLLKLGINQTDHWLLVVPLEGTPQLLRGVSRLGLLAMGIARFAGGQPILWFN